MLNWGCQPDSMLQPELARLIPTSMQAMLPNCCFSLATIVALLGFHDILLLLYSHGCEMGIDASTASLMCPLMAAVVGGHPECVSILIHECGCDPLALPGVAWSNLPDELMDGLCLGPGGTRRPSMVGVAMESTMVPWGQIETLTDQAIGSLFFGADLACLFTWFLPIASKNMRLPTDESYAAVIGVLTDAGVPLAGTTSAGILPYSAVGAAVQNANWEILQALLSAGLDIEAPVETSFGRDGQPSEWETPLNLFARCGEKPPKWFKLARSDLSSSELKCEWTTRRNRTFSLLDQFRTD